MSEPSQGLYALCLQALQKTDPRTKAEAARALYRDWTDQGLPLDTDTPCLKLEVPGRPAHPVLVSPAEVPRRKISSEAGRIRLVHAIAHIEFNAINLALDAVYRFRDMPAQYITDWLQVASEEALHFSLLADYLVAAGSAYGEYEAHNGLWDMAVKTDHDVMVRMALVPRVLEARGLDVTPGMIEQLERVGDERLVEILKVIFRDEIGHVRIGNRWYHHCCDQRGLDASETFFELLDQYMGRPLPGPFALDARREAGFSDTELELLMTRAR